MKTYSIIVPFTGHMEVFIDAENEEDAINKAFEVDVELKGLPENVEQFTWEYHRHITQGNICSAEYNDLEIEEIEHP